MAAHVSIETRQPAGNLDGTVYVLTAGNARAEIWPALGFNCYRWQAAGRELLYASPELWQNPVPTRSGIPVLFPFPNRIRAGRFQWDGKTYQLPLADSTKKNAIHGFACRHPWRVSDHGASADAAWARGEFQGTVDAPESLALWPADYRLTITYHLTESQLHLEAVVHNPDRRPLPFGLGFHPYFCVDADSWVEAPAESFWTLADNLPTGAAPPVDAARDLNRPRRIAELNLDDILTQLPADTFPLVRRGRIGTAAGGMELWTSPDFRELVAFTPVHRQAVCLEPYTCTTDAINLQLRGIDAGWRVLPPGQSWTGVVAMGGMTE